MTQLHDNPASSIREIKNINRVISYYPKIKEKLKYNILSAQNFQTELSRRRKLRRRFLLGLIGLTADFGITGSQLTGASKINDLYLAELNKEVSYEVEYQNNKKIPNRALIIQQLNEQSNSVLVLFGRNAKYKYKSLVIIDKAPFTLDCKATIKDPRLNKVYDELTETFNFVVLNNNPKPVSEYPVRGATNSVLDIKYNFDDGNTYLYPPEASGMGYGYDNFNKTFDNFLVYNGKHYLRPDKNCNITMKFDLINGNDYTVKAQSAGILLSVIYEDRLHVSQVLSGTSANYDISSNSSQHIEDTVTIPDWAYGMIQLCKVFDIYDRNGNYIYTIGVVLDAFVGRVIM